MNQETKKSRQITDDKGERKDVPRKKGAKKERSRESSVE